MNRNRISNKFISRINKFNEQQERTVIRKMRQSLNEGKRIAKQNAPVRTGRLRDEITVVQEAPNRFALFSTVPYVKFVRNRYIERAKQATISKLKELI